MQDSSAHIMVVDDEPEIRNSLRLYLVTEGYSVATAARAQEALDALSRNPADIVITDIKMPEMDGLDLLSEIKETFPKTDVVMISGHGGMQHAIEALRRGAFDYLQKPIELDELGIIVQRAIEKRDAQKRFQEVQEHLYHAQKMESLGTLAGGVAHEFNNLMGGIVGYAEMALKSDKPDLQHRALEISLRGAKRASEIAQNLLRFARRERYRRIPLDLNQIIRDILALVQKDFEWDQIIVETDLHDLPDLAVDQSQFQQVFLNIIVNARQALRKVTDSTRKLRIESHTEGNRIIVSFDDNGPGVAPDLRKRIFEPFFTTKGVLAGGDTNAANGLGLSVVSGIVHGHGGRIHIEDSVLGGARFVLEMTHDNVETDARKSALICDDEVDIRRVMHTILKNGGFIVDEAENGRQALDKVDHNEYNIMFLDQMMPIMTGIEVLKELQRRGRDLPVVMVTAHRQPELAREALLAGAHECVYKPVRAQKLLALAEKYARPRSMLESRNVPVNHVCSENKNILVVDGDPVIRDIYSLILSQRGFRVKTVASATEAMEMTREHSYDLIILDMIMCDIAGDVVVRGMRANLPYTPILLSVDQATHDTIQNALRLGASCVVEKPMNPGHVVDQAMMLIAMQEG